VRADVATPEPVAPIPADRRTEAGRAVPDDARVFGGAGDGEERAATFGGPDDPAKASTSGMRQ
jgi:hypothetical protein